MFSLDAFTALLEKIERACTPPQLTPEEEAFAAKMIGCDVPWKSIVDSIMRARDNAYRNRMEELREIASASSQVNASDSQHLNSAYNILGSISNMHRKIRPGLGRLVAQLLSVGITTPELNRFLAEVPSSIDDDVLHDLTRIEPVRSIQMARVVLDHIARGLEAMEIFRVINPSEAARSRQPFGRSDRPG